MSSPLDSCHCSDDEAFLCGLGDGEVDFGQGGGRGGTAEKILSGRFRDVEYVRDWMSASVFEIRRAWFGPSIRGLRGPLWISLFFCNFKVSHATR